MKLRFFVIAVALAAALLSPSAPLMADDPGAEAAHAGPEVNVIVTFRLGRLENGQRTAVKSYDLVVISGGPATSLLSGSRVPLPSSAGPDETGSDGQVNYVYQNIGFTSRVNAWVLGDGRIKLAATIEDSSVVGADPGQAGGPPTVETHQFSVNVVLHPGKPLELTRVQGIQQRSGFVEVEAHVLD